MLKLTQAYFIWSILTLTIVVNFSCYHFHDIPLPNDSSAFIQPITKTFAFRKPLLLDLSDSVTGIKASTKPLIFSKLPVKKYDDIGFYRFKKRADPIKFNLDLLPDSEFNFDKLPSKPLKFTESVLESPTSIKAEPPFLINFKKSFVYGLHEFQGSKITVSCLLKDKSGFLWIATNRGLFRYDGENLILYLRTPLTVITNMLQDNFGNIWMTTDKPGFFNSNLSVFDLKRGTIKHFINTINPDGSYITNILIDKQSRVWVSTLTEGLMIIDQSMKTVKYFSNGNGSSQNKNFGIIQDSLNRIWIETENDDLEIIDVKKRKIKYLATRLPIEMHHHRNNLNTILAHPDYRSGFGTTKIVMDHSNRMWMTSEKIGELVLIDLNASTIRRFNSDQGLSKNFISTLYCDQGGNLWVGFALLSDNGAKNDFHKNDVEVIDSSLEKIQSLNTSFTEDLAITNKIVEDSFGQFWIAKNTGLFMLHRNGQDVEYIGSDFISGFTEDSKGQIWINEEDLDAGAKIYDTATGLIRVLKKAQGLSSNAVNKFVAKDNAIWVLTDVGLDIIDSTQKLIKHIGWPHGLKVTGLLDIVEDKNGRLWLRTDTGVDIFDSNKGVLYKNITKANKSNINVSDIKLDSSGAVWITDLGGLIYRVDPNAFKMQILLSDLSGLNEGGNKLLETDTSGDLWIGADKNLYKIKANTNSIQKFSLERCGSGQITSLNEFDGALYVTTTEGVLILTKSDLIGGVWHFELLGKSDGFGSSRPFESASLVTKSGNLFSGYHGITILKKTEKNVFIPKTNLTGIDIFSQPNSFVNRSKIHSDVQNKFPETQSNGFIVNNKLTESNITKEQKKMQWDSVMGAYNLPVNLRLSYYQNYLQFHFAQANLGSQDTTWYRYVLDGAENKWNDKTSNTFSKNYINLAPGSYSFRVSSLYDGVWSNPSKFDFYISPPWWRTWWAYISYLLIFIFSVYGFSSYRSRQLKRENVLLEQKIKLRTNELELSLQELKSTQAQLIHSAKMASLGELTAGIAHEIQNPLNFVNNFSEVSNDLIGEMVEEVDKGNSDEVKAIANDIKQNLEKINHHGKRADAIVKGMLQHSRSSTGVKEPTNINALADEYLRLSYHGLRAKDKNFNAEIKTDFDNSIGNINIIPQDIGRVFLNLYNNAFYAVNEKAIKQPNGYEPTIIITTIKKGKIIELTVKDNGNGIPQKVLDKIFQPFFTTKPTGQGTGLGLSLSYDIIKAHGGEIKVDTKEGEFTEFVIQLPVSI